MGSTRSCNPWEDRNMRTPSSVLSTPRGLKSLTGAKTLQNSPKRFFRPQKNTHSASKRSLWNILTPRKAKNAGANKKYAFKLRDSNAESHTVTVMSGWLEKCEQSFNCDNWVFAVLTKNQLRFYADINQQKCRGCMDISAEMRPGVSIQTNFTDNKNVFVISTCREAIILSAPTQQEMIQWILKLQSNHVTWMEDWNPSRKTVNYLVGEHDRPHEWKRYDDPTMYIRMEGYLLTHFGMEQWTISYARIENGALQLYNRDQEDKKTVCLKGTRVRPGSAQAQGACSTSFVLFGSDLQIGLKATSVLEMYNWLEALQEAQLVLQSKRTIHTVPGLACIMNQADSIPLLQVEIEYVDAESFDVEFERKTEAVIVSKSWRNSVPFGSQLSAINGDQVLEYGYDEVNKVMAHADFPLRLRFLLLPRMSGSLCMKQRSKWIECFVSIRNGEFQYFRCKSSETLCMEKKKRKSLYASFSLSKSQLSLIQVENRTHCFAIAPFKKRQIVFQAQNMQEWVQWTTILYCSMQMMTQGVTPSHFAQLKTKSF